MKNLDMFSFLIFFKVVLSRTVGMVREGRKEGKEMVGFSFLFLVLSLSLSLYI